MANQITPAQTFNKFSTVIVVQEFVPQYGWVDVGEESTSKDAKETMKAYRGEGIQCRTIRRRVLNKDAFLCQALVNFCREYFHQSCGFWPANVEVLKANGVVKYKLTQDEIFEVLGNDRDLITL